MSTIKFTIKGPNRAWVSIMGLQIFFSYDTPMAFIGEVGEVTARIRRTESRSNTTRKHMGQECVTHYTQVDDDEFERLLAIAVQYAVHPQFAAMAMIEHGTDARG
jgi:hypothetical protein